MNTKCHAFQLSDLMVCKCGNAWGASDPAPPACARLIDQTPEQISETLNRAVSLLVNSATAGCEPFYDDGTPTPNRDLHLATARTLHALCSSAQFDTAYGPMLGRTPTPQPAPDGWGVFALTAPGVYTLQQVTHGDREDAERAASRFIRGCDAHVRPLFAGSRV